LWEIARPHEDAPCGRLVGNLSFSGEPFAQQTPTFCAAVEIFIRIQRASAAVKFKEPLTIASVS
jgi:hypothetical protein